MVVEFFLQNKAFEWDSEKADSNAQKHGITFEQAAQVFFDRLAVEGDASNDDNEIRSYLIGFAFSLKMLVVVYTERGERERIISA